MTFFCSFVTNIVADISRPGKPEHPFHRLNQYAKVANTTGSIYAGDIEEMRKKYDPLWDAMRELLMRLAALCAMLR